MDKAKGLCYEQDGVFCLVCKTSIPAGTFTTFETPVIDSPLVFAGWIKDPCRWMEFEVLFSKEPGMLTDPLEMKLLEAQEEQQQLENGSSIDDNWMKEKKSPAKGNLKAPPSYALKESPGNLKDTVERKCNLKAPPSTSKAGDSTNTIFVVSGCQIGNDDDTPDDRKISFRGAYRCPSNTPFERLHLICSIQTHDGATSGSAASSGAAAASAGTSSVAAAGSKKRNRSSGDDDDSVEGNVGVAYQELIDLHDDTRLSTEELRNRYYGSGDKKGEDGEKRAASTKRLKGRYNKGNNKKDVEDDNDDAYGF